MGRCFGHFGSDLFSKTRSKNSVSVVPGLTTRTSIPSPCSSARIDSLKPWTANLLAAVLAVVRRAAAAQDRTDVDENRPNALLQQRQRQPGHLDQGEKVDLHDAADPVGIGKREQPDRADAGVVDQNIQAPEFRSGRVDHSLPDGRIGDVAGDRFDGRFAPCDFRGQCAQSVLAPGRDDQRNAVPGQFEAPWPARSRWKRRSQSHVGFLGRVSSLLLVRRKNRPQATYASLSTVSTLPFSLPSEKPPPNARPARRRLRFDRQGEQRHAARRDGKLSTPPVTAASSMRTAGGMPGSLNAMGSLPAICHRVPPPAGFAALMWSSILTGWRLGLTTASVSVLRSMTQGGHGIERVGRLHGHREHAEMPAVEFQRQARRLERGGRLAGLDAADRH